MMKILDVGRDTKTRPTREMQWAVAKLLPLDGGSERWK